MASIIIINIYYISIRTNPVEEITSFMINSPITTIVILTIAALAIVLCLITFGALLYTIFTSPTSADTTEYPLCNTGDINVGTLLMHHVTTTIPQHMRPRALAYLAGSGNAYLRNPNIPSMLTALRMQLVHGRGELTWEGLLDIITDITERMVFTYGPNGMSLILEVARRHTAGATNEEWDRATSMLKLGTKVDNHNMWLAIFMLVTISLAGDSNTMGVK